MIGVTQKYHWSNSAAAVSSIFHKIISRFPHEQQELLQKWLNCNAQAVLAIAKWWGERQTDRETHRDTQRNRHTQRQRQRERQTQTHTERHTQRDTHTETETESDHFCALVVSTPDV